MEKRLLNLFAASVALALASCASVSSTTKRAGITGTAGLATGAAAYSLTNHNPVATMLSATAGAALAQIAEGEDPNVRQAGFDEGYLHGQSDAIKREYFLRHAREAEPLANSAGETVYYVMPGPEVTVDGRKLEPHHVAVRVVE
jgi:hypothetical protein